MRALSVNLESSCCNLISHEKKLLTSHDEHQKESYSGLLSLQAFNVVYRVVESVYSMKGLSQELE